MIAEIDTIPMPMIAVQTYALDLGDPFGFETDTVDFIASELQISTREVEKIFDKWR
jgi:hypothetical protein